jgi:hypothetical protein
MNTAGRRSFVSGHRGTTTGDAFRVRVVVVGATLSDDFVGGLEDPVAATTATADATMTTSATPAPTASCGRDGVLTRAARERTALPQKPAPLLKTLTARTSQLVNRHWMAAVHPDRSRAVVDRSSGCHEAHTRQRRRNAATSARPFAPRVQPAEIAG